MMSEERVMSVIGGVGIAGMSLFCLIPVAYMIAVSLSGTPDIFALGASMTGQNYFDVLTSENLHVLAYLRNSLVISLSAPCARCLSRRWRRMPSLACRFRDGCSALRRVGDVDVSTDKPD